MQWRDRKREERERERLLSSLSQERGKRRENLGLSIRRIIFRIIKPENLREMEKRGHGKGERERERERNFTLKWRKDKRERYGFSCSLFHYSPMHHQWDWLANGKWWWKRTNIFPKQTSKFFLFISYINLDMPKCKAFPKIQRMEKRGGRRSMSEFIC